MKDAGSLYRCYQDGVHYVPPQSMMEPGGSVQEGLRATKTRGPVDQGHTREKKIYPEVWGQKTPEAMLEKTEGKHHNKTRLLDPCHVSRWASTVATPAREVNNGASIAKHSDSVATSAKQSDNVATTTVGKYHNKPTDTTCVRQTLSR